MSARTIILLGATVVGAAATIISAIKDNANDVCECEGECICDECEGACELADPTE